MVFSLVGRGLSARRRRSDKTPAGSDPADESMGRPRGGRIGQDAGVTAPRRDTGIRLILAYKLGKAALWMVLATTLGVLITTGRLEPFRDDGRRAARPTSPAAGACSSAGPWSRP